jgi:hypothetical protein
MMMRGVLAINWNYPGDAIPAFVTLMFMPFSYSIAYGLVAGIMSYAAINSVTWAVAKISRGRIMPPDYENKEYWSCKCSSHFTRLDGIGADRMVCRPLRFAAQPAVVHSCDEGRPAVLEG